MCVNKYRDPLRVGDGYVRSAQELRGGVGGEGVMSGSWNRAAWSLHQRGNSSASTAVAASATLFGVAGLAMTDLSTMSGEDVGASAK